MPAVFHVRGRPAITRIGPYSDAARLASAQIHPRQFAVVAARPDNVVVSRIGNRESAFAPADMRPFAGGNAAAEEAALAFQVVAGPAKRCAILAIGVNEIRNPIVGIDVVNLRNRQLHVRIVFSAIEADGASGIIRNHHALRIQRIKPHIMVVAPGRAKAGGIGSAFASKAGNKDCMAAVDGNAEANGDEKEFVLVIRRHAKAHVIRRALRQHMLLVDELPGLPCVV